MRNVTGSTESNPLTREVVAWLRTRVLGETPENRGDLSHNLSIRSVLEFTWAECFFRVGMNNDESAF